MSHRGAGRGHQSRAAPRARPGRAAAAPSARAGAVGADQRDQVGARDVRGGAAPRLRRGARRARAAARPDRRPSRRAPPRRPRARAGRDRRAPTATSRPRHRRDGDRDAQGGAVVEQPGRAAGRDERRDRCRQCDGAGPDEEPPWRPRRTHSTHQATAWATAVAATSQSSTGTSAIARAGRAPMTYDVAPSTTQAWIIQAMLSGASSSAPRWSVVGLSGKATAWSRGSSSRPPPDAGGRARVIRAPTVGGGKQQERRRAGVSAARARTPGRRPPATVIERRSRRARSARLVGPPAHSGERKCSSGPTSPTARRDSRHRVRAPGQVSRGARGRHRAPSSPRISAGCSSATADRRAA